MRERIANALEVAPLCESGTMSILQRQTSLIHTAQITNDRWLLCLCDHAIIFHLDWSGSWLSRQEKRRIEASESGDVMKETSGETITLKDDK